MGSRSHSGATWHHPPRHVPIPRFLLDLVRLGSGGAPAAGGHVGGSITAHLAPQLRGRVNPRVLLALEARGYTVHRLGAAAYVHGAGHHLILGVWAAGAPAPAWSLRLGRPSAGYCRRLERRDRELRAARFLRDEHGRFAIRLPWWRLPTVTAYPWEPAQGSWLERAERRAAIRNRAVLERRGLVRDPWYGETAPTLSRAMDGDR
jgi:hypothetical protein